MIKNMEFSNETTLVLYLLFFAVTAWAGSNVEKNYEIADSSFSFRLKGRYIEYNKGLFLIELFFLLIPCIIVGFRYGIGTDYFHYEASFENYAKSSYFNFSQFGGISTEIGNYILIKVSWLLCHNYRGYLIGATLITYACFWKFFKQYIGTCKYHLMTIICLTSFLGPSMNIIRQTMAVAIVSLGIRYIFERKPLKYVLVVLIAVCFHTSAIVCLPLYLLYSENESVFRRFVNWGICLAAPTFYNVLYNIFIDSAIFARYATFYVNSEGALTYGTILTKLPILVLVLIFYRDLISLDKRNRFLIYMFILELSLSVLSVYMEWAFRFMYYMMISEIVLVPQILSFVDEKSRWLASALIVLYYVACFVLNSYLHGTDGIFPYAFSLLG